MMVCDLPNCKSYSLICLHPSTPQSLKKRLTSLIFLPSPTHITLLVSKSTTTVAYLCPFRIENSSIARWVASPKLKGIVLWRKYYYLIAKISKGQITN